MGDVVILRIWGSSFWMNDLNFRVKICGEGTCELGLFKTINYRDALERCKGAFKLRVNFQKTRCFLPPSALTSSIQPLPVSEPDSSQNSTSRTQAKIIPLREYHWRSSALLRCSQSRTRQETGFHMLPRGLRPVSRVAMGASDI